MEQQKLLRSSVCFFLAGDQSQRRTVAKEEECSTKGFDVNIYGKDASNERQLGHLYKNDIL